jgi:hypothetical protein
MDQNTSNIPKRVAVAISDARAAQVNSPDFEGFSEREVTIDSRNEGDKDDKM